MDHYQDWFDADSMFNSSRCVKLVPKFSLRPSRLKWWLLYWCRRKKFDAIMGPYIDTMQTEAKMRVVRSFLYGDYEKYAIPASRVGKTEALWEEMKEREQC